MKIPILALATLITLPLLGAGCDKNSSSLSLERQRRIRAESWIRRAEGALRSCKRHVSQLQRYRYKRNRRCGSGNRHRIAALQRQLNSARAQVYARNQRIATLSRQLAQLRAQMQARRLASRNVGAVRVLAVRRYRGWLTPALRRQMMTPPKGLLQCYRRHVLARTPNQPRILWEIFATHRRGVYLAGVQGVPHRPGAPGFRRCVATVLGQQRHWKTRGIVRFAILIAFAPQAAQLPRLKRPAFAWPWKAPRGKYAQVGQVCRVGGRQIRGYGRLNPHLSRPCAPGLRCCYPCGVQGCNSICKKVCGPPRP